MITLRKMRDVHEGRAIERSLPALDIFALSLVDPCHTEGEMPAPKNDAMGISAKDEGA